MSAAEDLREAAIEVIRNLPAAHWFTKFWRQNKFRTLADAFTNHVYETDVTKFNLRDFDVMEAAIDIATHAIEIHLLEHTQSDHAAHRHYFNLIERLRTAREGIIRGYAADPARRPSESAVVQAGLEKLRAVFADESTPSRTVS